MIDPDLLRRLASGIAPAMIEVRRRLHRTPETRFREEETAATIRQLLPGAGARLLPPLLGTDTAAVLDGARPGRTVLLRADIDALPLPDRTGRPWCSTREGASHACGHDGHIAMLLGAARLLAGLRDELAGSVLLVFQPAEEEEGGGKMLIEKGLLERGPRPDAAFALHGWPGLPAGSVGAGSGAVMAAADRFFLTVKGSGGHGALPHRASDPVLAAAHLVTALQSVVSRSVDPLAPAVLSVCSIHGGQASNVIPDSVTLEGTVRYFDSRLRGLIADRMERIAAGTCAAFGCAHELACEDGYIPLVNDAGMVGVARTVVERHLGPGAWNESDPLTMGAEDFAYYLARVPGALLRLGLGEAWPRLHTPEFDFNDDAIAAGITVLAGLALEFCTGGAG
jgi:amidohydrolase